MKNLHSLLGKKTRIAIGLMSGTCTDGIDAALVQLDGFATDTKVKLLEFITIPYANDLKVELLNIASGSFGGSYAISKTNFLLGQLSAEACLAVCEKAHIPPSAIDFIGSHGHTIYHQPNSEEYFSHSVTSTLQIGESAVISEVIGCPVVADFRVRDMAAGGYGAPLVPYTEYLLYSVPGKNIALQNIGGIGNITYLPHDCDMSNILAFDTGPGNMIIDSLIALHTSNEKNYDEGGQIAASGHVHPELLNWLLDDPYIHSKPPKTTGREYYGAQFVAQLHRKAQDYHLSFSDLVATTTMFTAKAIEINVTKYLPSLPENLIVGGGGSHNKTLLRYIKSCLPNCHVITNEDIGLDSNAKEAIAFAVLANETIQGINNNVPTATGARHGVVMGKISF
ncbi:anhydro-N-acetylmuramic acid kinase [Vallitalea okinawensis]|uniref:anhydro-N-acetylmuramic acid kinase n=1 Tax=Vallitalea okinawensis TaxID=2078660 RepID=UPI000CFDB7EE|nr:anhydro-N-acetylmuramic acid kinase [Vallitalea okinawensis]